MSSQMKSRPKVSLQVPGLGYRVNAMIPLVLLPATLVDALTQRNFGVRILRVPCLISLVTGKWCPGCGLTRAICFLWQGHFRDAVALNPLSPLVFSLLFMLFCLQASKWVIFQREILTAIKHLPRWPRCIKDS